MVKKLMLAISVVAMATPSFAAVQNVKVSGDLINTSVIRSGIQNFGTPNTGTTSSNDIVSQLGLNVQSDLTDNVSTYFRFTNDRLWGAAQTGSTLRVNTASVTMKELFYAPLTVTVGRQPLAYGNQLVIGDGDANTDLPGFVSDLDNNVNFDAIKAVLTYDPLTVDLFAARVNNGTVTVGENGGGDNKNLYGINASYKMGDKMSTVVEAYTFVENNANVVSNTVEKPSTTYTPGLRLSTNPIEGLNVQLEGAYQTGIYNVNANRDGRTSAYALQTSASYALPVLKDMKPVLSAGYTYLSGDKSKTGFVNEGWSAPYSNQFAGTIFYAEGLSQSNLRIASLTASIDPIKDLNASVTWYNLMEARQSQTTFSTTRNGSEALGNELDLNLKYAYTEDVSFGVNAGYQFPGNHYANSVNDGASQVLSSVKVAF